MNSQFLCFLLSLFLVSTSFAELNCESLESLDRRSQDCNDNINYSNAGSACFRKLQSDISASLGIIIPEINKDKIKPEKIPAPKKSELIERIQEAWSSVTGYRNNIFYPEDWDAPEEMIGNGSEFLKSQRCYNQANERLKKIQDDIKAYLAIFGVREPAKIKKSSSPKKKKK